jgi:ABC-type uncharacterized transport system substrate-binding protein
VAKVVKVEEPSEKVATAMIRGLVSILELHHKVRILDEAVSEAVRLSARYIPARQLPDKAVSLIDTACARVAMSQNAIPAPIDDRQRRIGLIDTELKIVEREMSSGADHTTRRDELTAERLLVSDELAALQKRWEEERAIVTEIDKVRGSIDAALLAKSGAADGAGNGAAGNDGHADRAKLAELSTRLRALQGEQPLIFPVVDGQAIAEIVEGWTGIPARRMQSDEIKTVLNLREAMERRVIGQSHAMEAVAQAIRTSRAGLTDPRRPIGVFLLVGTSGVGKTETALSLAQLLYGGEQNVTTINMSEFKEEHKVSLLMGSPPGYVGYGEGGVLTEAVRRRPYSVVLLDEMEKAHPGVQDVFFSVFDKGNMKDGEGRDIDFERRYAAGDLKRLPALANELVKLKPDVILTTTSAAALAFAQITQSIPIVATALVDPVGSGLAASEARPGRQVTGILISLEPLPGKQLALALEVVPGTAKVGVLLNALNPTTAVYRAGIEAAAATLSIKLVSVEVRGSDDLDAAFQEFLREKVELVFVAQDSLLLSERARIATLATAARLPTMYGLREHVEAGGLICYGINVAENFRRAARFVDKILKGAKAGDLPIELPVRLDLLVNLKTAKSIGLVISESFLVRADEVIE